MSTRRTWAPGDLAARLFAGEGYGEIAADLDVSRATVARWAEDPEVVAELDNLRAEVRARVVNRTARLAVRAVEVHAEIMDGDAPPAVRLAAARTLLDRFLPVAAVSEVQVSGAVDLRRVSDAELEIEARALAAVVLGRDSSAEAPPAEG